MPLSSAFAGFDPEKEELAKRHIEVYRRKKHRSKSPVLVQRDLSIAIRERVGQWEAEKGLCTTDLHYAQARATYLEDIIRLQRESVERPLRKQNNTLEAKLETMQNQLNLVVSKMELQATELHAKDATIAELKEDKQMLMDTTKDERSRLISMHEKHLAAEKRVFDAETERLTTELRTMGSELETTQRRPSHASPSNSRLQWMREEQTKREAEVTKLSESLEKKDAELREAQDKLRLLETEMVIAGGTLEHDNFVKMWECLSGLILDTDRQRAGLKTAVSQLELCSIGRQPGKAKPIPPMPQQGETLRRWTDSLALLCSTTSDEAGDGRSYSVAVLRKVIEAHQSSIEVSAEKERVAAGMKGIERQRLSEIERDRDEERRLFVKERERLRSEAAGLKKSMGELQANSKKFMGQTIDSNAQTETSLGALAESYTQTVATAGDPQLSLLKTDVDIKQGTIQDLSRSVDTKDATIRSLREQRERFLSFIFETAPEREEVGSPKQIETHSSPHRPNEMAQVSTFEYMIQ